MVKKIAFEISNTSETSQNSITTLGQSFSQEFTAILLNNAKTKQAAGTENFVKNIYPEEKISAVIIEKLEMHSEKLEAIDKKLESASKTHDPMEASQYALAACQGLQALGRAIKCPELEKGAAFASAGLQIGIGIATLPAGVLSILSGVANLFGLFGDSGPSPSQIILEQIGKLSQQMVNMHNDMIKLFEANFKIQETILKTLHKGFEMLSQQTSNQIGSFRVEITETLKRIEAMQVALAQQIVHGQQTLYLKDFTDIQTQAEYCIARYYEGDIQKNVTEMANHLSTWAIQHASNSLLNGAMIKNHTAGMQKNEQLLESFLSENPKITANSSLGFFNIALPNPVIWLTAINSYTRLVERYWNILIASEQSEKIADQGRLIEQFFQHVKKDPLYWDEILKNYQDTLKEIKDIIHAFSMHRSKILIDTHDKYYLTAEKYKLDHGSSENLQSGLNDLDLNLLEVKPDVFLQKFNTRGANEIKIEISPTSCARRTLNAKNVKIESNDFEKITELTNIKRVYKTLSLDSTLLVLEYFKLLVFIVEQEGFSETVDTLLTSTSTTWNLPFVIKIKFINDSIEETLQTVNFQIPVDNAKEIQSKFNSKDSIESTTFPSGKKEEIVKKGKQLVEKYIVHLRQEIAHYFFEGKIIDDNKGQEILERFKGALVKLDFFERQIRHNLYYAEKNLSTLNGKAFSARLINSKIILKKLRTYASKNIDALTLEKPEWLAVIDQAVNADSCIKIDEIMALPEYIAHPAGHPQQIVEIGLLRLEFCSETITAYRTNLPLFARFQDLKKYQYQADRNYFEIAVKNILDLLYLQMKVRYNKAKFSIKKTSISSLTPNDYKKAFFTFSEFGTTTSREREFIGNTKQVNFNQISVDNISLQALVKLQVDRGWYGSIAILYALALTSGAKKAPDKKGILNFYMYHNGLRKLLKMLFYPEINKQSIGLSAINDAKEIDQIQLGHLQIFQARGNAFYNVLENIVMSPIINQLSRQYSEILKQIHLFINKKTLDGDSEKEVIDNLLKEQFEGSTVKLLDTLDMLSILLSQYIHMCFEYFIPKNGDLAPTLINSGTLLAILQNHENEDPATRKTLNTKINIHVAEINKDIMQITEILNTVRELINFREALQKISQGHNAPLVSLRGSLLVIHAAAFMFHWSEQKSRLLDNFLQQVHGVSGLSIEDDDFNTSVSLISLLDVVKRHLNIRSLALQRCEIDAEVLLKCQNEFKILYHVRYFDFSDNNMLPKNLFVAARKMHALTNFLGILPEYSRLNLSHIGITDVTFYQLASYLNFTTSKLPEIFITDFILPKDSKTRNLSKKLHFEVDIDEHNHLIDLKNVRLTRMTYIGPIALEQHLSLLKNIIRILERKIAMQKTNHNQSTVDFGNNLFGIFNAEIKMQYFGDYQHAHQTLKIK